jgi:hypothetical protein
MRQLISLPIIISAALLAATITTAHAGSGAIAASMSNDGVIGFAYGSGTQEDAARWAMLDCPDKGGSDCRLLGSETEQCLVLIGKPGLYVTGYSIYTAYSREAGLGASNYASTMRPRARRGGLGDDPDEMARGVITSMDADDEKHRDAQIAPLPWLGE